jgi:polar amino acid transport system substrate-binding protein
MLGEGCHFVDLAAWIVGTTAERVSCTIRPRIGETLQTAQRFSMTLEYPDESLATIVYTDGGASGLPKERIEAHARGRSAILDDFRTLELRDGSKSRSVGGRAQDKGHERQFVRLREALQGTASSMVLDPLQSMATALAALDAASTGQGRRIGEEPSHSFEPTSGDELALSHEMMES